MKNCGFRQPKSGEKPLGHSTPRPYVSERVRNEESGTAKPLVTQHKANIRDHFFQTPLAAPPLISSIISQPKLLAFKSSETNAFSLPKLPSGSLSSTKTSTKKKYYETDLDLTIKVPKSVGDDQTPNCKESGTTSSSRVINISVTKSQSLNFASSASSSSSSSSSQKDPVDTRLNKENTQDVKTNFLVDKTNSKSQFYFIATNNCTFFLIFLFFFYFFFR